MSISFVVDNDIFFDYIEDVFLIIKLEGSMFSLNNYLTSMVLILSLCVNNVEASCSPLPEEEGSQESWGSWIYKGTVGHLKRNAGKYVVATCAAAVVTTSYLAFSSDDEGLVDNGTCPLSDQCFEMLKVCYNSFDPTLQMWFMDWKYQAIDVYYFINGTFEDRTYGHSTVKEFLYHREAYGCENSLGTSSGALHLLQQLNETICRYVYSVEYNDMSYPLTTSDWGRATL